MKSYKLITAITLIVILVLGVLYLLSNNVRSKFQKNTDTNPTTTIDEVMIKESTANSDKNSDTSSKYTPEQRAKVRNDFINSCNTKGNYPIPVCTCVADYLSKNYSDTELAKIYIQYHISNQVPNDLQIALDDCSKQ